MTGTKSCEGSPGSSHSSKLPLGRKSSLLRVHSLPCKAFRQQRKMRFYFIIEFSLELRANEPRICATAL